MSKNSIYTCVAFAISFLISGCTSVSDSNQFVNIPNPTISSTNSVADIRIANPVKGSGCASQFLLIFTGGDNHFLELYGNGSSGLVAKAKAAAAYNALTEANGLSTDIIVNPVWEVTDTNWLISRDVCVDVVGFRGKIEGFRQDGTVTHPAPEVVKPQGLLARFSPF